MLNTGTTQAEPSRRADLGHALAEIERPGAIGAPLAPNSLSQTGLSLQFLSDLVLKMLLLEGGTLGIDLAKQMCLPFKVVEEALLFLKDERCIEVSTGELIGRVSYRYQLTDLGRARAQDAMTQSRYAGPAPVPLEGYVSQCYQQAVAGSDCDAASLRVAFSDLIIEDDLLSELGPAVCSGRSMFIYGPPGNGKTVVARGLGQYLNRWGGEIYVPYAFLASGAVVTVYDPTVHEVTDDENGPESYPDQPGADVVSRLLADRTPDRRWRRVRRPVVITGGELTLDMLDLRYNSAANFYQAPLHIKANGGVFLVDDFGRQIVSPRDLLNRWILPLEERRDYLTLATGRKFAVPFEQLIIFSTNLEPRELVDEAFLRRIRHKIHIDSPTREFFTEIFKLVCRRLQLNYEPTAVDYLYDTYYSKGRIPRASDPRDLLEIVRAICRFRKEPARLSTEILAASALRFFSQI